MTAAQGPLDSSLDAILPAGTLHAVRSVDLVFAETAKSARAFLKAAQHPTPIAGIEIHEMAALTDAAACASALRIVAAGRDAAVVSDAGAPGVADPGAHLIRSAHSLGIRVVPCVGPSALLLALMAGGLGGQHFTFHGYLPVDRGELAAALRRIEARSANERATQMFIETPYRNDRLVTELLSTCKADTLLSIAVDLTLATESIETRSIGTWRSRPPAIGKRPAVFSLLAGPF